MSERIAAVGSFDSVSYFGILGCRIFETRGGMLSEEQMSELKRGEYHIILLTEEVLEKNRDFFRGENGITGPAVTVVPDLRAAVWKAGKPVSSGMPMDEIRRAVIRAIGQDISNSTQE